MHQIKHLIDVKRHGAISFIIVRFTTLDKTFLLDTSYLESFINKNERKSIPLSYFEEYGKLIKMKYSPRMDYLDIINKEYFGGI